MAASADTDATTFNFGAVGHRRTTHGVSDARTLLDTSQGRPLLPDLNVRNGWRPIWPYASANCNLIWCSDLPLRLRILFWIYQLVILLETSMYLDLTLILQFIHDLFCLIVLMKKLDWHLLVHIVMFALLFRYLRIPSLVITICSNWFILILIRDITENLWNALIKQPLVGIIFRASTENLIILLLLLLLEFV